MWFMSRCSTNAYIFNTFFKWVFHVFYFQRNVQAQVVFFFFSFPCPDLQGTAKYPHCTGRYGNLVCWQQVQHWRRPHGDPEGVHEVPQRLHKGEMWLCSPLLVSVKIRDDVRCLSLLCWVHLLNKKCFHFIRGNRFHSSWGGASYMGGVCSLSKGGGVNEVTRMEYILQSVLLICFCLFFSKKFNLWFIIIIF